MFVLLESDSMYKYRPGYCCDTQLLMSSTVRLSLPPEPSTARGQRRVILIDCGFTSK